MRLNYRAYSLAILPTLILSSFVFRQQQAKADICPVIGLSNECRSFVVLTDSYYGTLIESKNIASYDNSNNFIFGLVNNSSKTITSIGTGGYYPVSSSSIAQTFLLFHPIVLLEPR
jgi:hypothetical protein